MDSRQHRDDLARQLAALERQLMSLRAQLRPEPEPPIRAAFTAIGIEIGSVRYALDSSIIQKIIPLISWQPLPEAPRWVLGVFRYRGRTLTLIDLHRRLLDVELPLHASMVILVTKAPHAVGFVASGITNLVHVEPKDITPPPTDVSYAPFITGSLSLAGEDVMHILSAPRLRRESVLGLEDCAAGAEQEPSQ